MRPGVKQESAAGELHFLPPGVFGVYTPVLPDNRTDVQNRSQFTRAQHRDSGADLCRQAALESHHEQFTSPIPCLDQTSGFGGIHDHRFFEQHVQARLKAGFGLVVVIGMWRDDKHCIEVFSTLRQQA